MSPILATVLLLTVSNVLMCFAWYGHLRTLANVPILGVILIAWGIAFFEYCFAVPANRIGYTVLTGYQLKILQECITLTVFVGFAWVVLGEKLRWNYLAAFACIALAVVFAFGFNQKA